MKKTLGAKYSGIVSYLVGCIIRVLCPAPLTEKSWAAQMAWPVLLVLPMMAAGEGSLGNQVFDQVGFKQRLGSQVPAELVFQDASGRSVSFRQLFAGRPLILALAYHRCPNLCGLTIGGLVDALREMPLQVGEDFDVIVASIDPREGPEVAAVKRQETVLRYGRGGSSGWHFLSAEEPAIRALAQAVGFRYAYDSLLDQYAHAAGVVVLTGEGVVSRYLYGLRFPPQDLRLGLTEAGNGTVGGLAEQVLLLCYQYDPETGTYGGLVMNLLRLTGAAGVLVLGTLLGRSMWRERRGAQRPKRGSAEPERKRG